VDAARKRKEEEDRLRAEMEARNAALQAKEEAALAAAIAAANAAEAARAEQGQAALLAGSDADEWQEEEIAQRSAGQQQAQERREEQLRRQQEERISEAEQQEARLRAIAEGRDEPVKQIGQTTTALGDLDATPTATAEPEAIPTPAPWQTPTPHGPEDSEETSGTFPPTGFQDPLHIPRLVELGAEGSSRFRLGRLGPNIEWGQTFWAHTPTSNEVPVESGVGMGAGPSGDLSPSQFWNFSLGDFELQLERKLLSPSWQLTWRDDPVVAEGPGDTQVEFRRSWSIEAEGSFWNQVATFRNNELDFRVRDGSSAPEGMAYSGGTGTYVEFRPARVAATVVLVAAAVVVTAALLPWETIVAGVSALGGALERGLGWLAGQ
jgi:hypothetical protein